MKYILILVFLINIIKSDICEERFGCILALKNYIYMPILNEKNLELNLCFIQKRSCW